MQSIILLQLEHFSRSYTMACIFFVCDLMFGNVALYVSLHIGFFSISFSAKIDNGIAYFVFSGCSTEQSKGFRLQDSIKI